MNGNGVYTGSVYKLTTSPVENIWLICDFKQFSVVMNCKISGVKMFMSDQPFGEIQIFRNIKVQWPAPTFFTMMTIVLLIFVLLLALTLPLTRTYCIQRHLLTKYSPSLLHRNGIVIGNFEVKITDSMTISLVISKLYHLFKCIRTKNSFVVLVLGICGKSNCVYGIYPTLTSPGEYFQLSFTIGWN